MNKIVNYLVFLFIITATYIGSVPTFAETAYVIDVIYVELRSGKGNQYRIIETRIASGTKVETMREEEDERGTKWSFVETEKGNQGWIQSQYIQGQMVAKDRLAEAQRQLTTLRQQQQSATGKASNLESENTQLKTQLDTVTAEANQLRLELEQLRTVSAGAISLNENNQRLMEEREILKTRIDVVEAENERLSDESNQTWFLYGAYAVGIGCLLTLIIQKVRVKRRQSEWA